MKESILLKKSHKFAIRIVNMYKFLSKERKENVISKQVLRSGTSIGANVAEAFYGQSKADFVNKLSIARKECSETIYWIDLLHETEYLSDELYLSILKDCNEVMRLLTASIKTANNK